MKRLILSGMAAATLAGGMAMAFAVPAFAAESGTGPNLDACSTAGAPVGVTNSPGGAQVCLAPNPANPVLPSGGSLTASGSPTTKSGYVILQGGDANQGALKGYIGVSSSEGVVGCNSGDFQGTGDNVIASQTSPTGSTNPVTGSCSAVPAAP
ncbi:MAG: hypothetical protein ACYCV7_17295 [Acidimicrobiales bacterium]